MILDFEHFPLQGKQINKATDERNSVYLKNKLNFIIALPCLLELVIFQVSLIRLSFHAAGSLCVETLALNSKTTHFFHNK